MKLLSFEGYKILSESTKSFEADLDKTLNENIGAALGSPIKFTKIKNNAKKYQQALVQIAINNLDFEKKKATGNLDPKKSKVLAAANNQKNQALKDQASAISDRMDQLATTPGLKKVASVAKNKSKMAAAETALKTAEGEEAKALKLKIKGLNQKVAADQRELKDYEKAKPETKPDTEKEAKPETKPKTKPDTEKEATDPTAKIEADIAAFDKNIEDEMKRVATLKKDLEQSKRDVKTGRGSENAVVKIQKDIDDSNQDIAEMKKRKADAKKKLDNMAKESNEYVAESVAQKFRRLTHS